MNEIEIKFTTQERDLIIDHTFTGPNLTQRLQIAEITDDKKNEKKLDRLFDKLNSILEKYV